MPRLRTALLVPSAAVLLALAAGPVLGAGSNAAVWHMDETSGTMSNSAVLSIGAKAEGGDWYKGSMDEVTIVTGS